MDKKQAKTGNLTITLATFIYMLYDAGTIINDSKIKGVCEKIEELIRRASLRGCVDEIQSLMKKHRLNASDSSIQSFINETYGDNVFEDVDINEIGMELVNAIEESISAQADINDLYKWLSERYDNIENSWNSDTREELICNIRQQGFKSSLPWLAQIAERNDNQLVTHWVLVEKVTDKVICMDPYPWDDIDEEYELPLVDFMVKWELAGSNSVHVA